MDTLTDRQKAIVRHSLRVIQDHIRTGNGRQKCDEFIGCQCFNDVPPPSAEEFDEVLRALELQPSRVSEMLKRTEA